MGKLIVLTGAGLSAESGLRTFRDSDGLWENHSIDDVCNGATWRANFELVHNFYNDRRTQLASVTPNAAHRSIAQWQERYDAVLLTQNVDDLLERAGCRDVVHLHGFLPELACVACGQVWNIGYTAWEQSVRCPGCRHEAAKGVRPNIVFFGEQAPKYETMWNAFHALTPEDVVVVIGTSGVVLPVTEIALQFPGFKILNNLAMEPAIDDAAFEEVFYQPATKAAAEIDRVLRERLG